MQNLRAKLMPFACVSALALVLTGCGPGGFTNQNVGAVTGGVVGGLLGNSIGGGSGKVVATIGGAIIGSMIGGGIGAQMDRADQARVRQCINNVPTGRVSSWTNPDTGNRYSVQPTRTYYQDSQPCREFTTIAVIGGKRQKMYGTACRQTDGSWQMMNNSPAASYPPPPPPPPPGYYY
jgi:surface antigen